MAQAERAEGASPSVGLAWRRVALALAVLVGLAALLALSLGALFGPALPAVGHWTAALSEWVRSAPFRSAQRVAVAPPWAGKATGAVREFSLSVGRAEWELAPGKVVRAYAYDGQVPGPELRVTEGDLVRVRVTNALDEPTTVHWHGVELPVGMDGVPQLSQAPIAPGASFTYEFVATPAGTRWYHAHFDELAQQGGGLAGALIIEPRAEAAAAANAPKADREYTVVAGEWVTAVAPAERAGMGGMMGSGGGQPLFDTFTVNGKAYPAAAPLRVRRGERVRLRLINAGATQTQVWALAGHRLTLTHTDGNALARPIDVDAVPLGVGERADVEFVADRPGRWLLRGVAPEQHERGLAVDVVYEGYEDARAQDFPPGARARPPTYAELPGPRPAPGERAVSRRYDLVLSAAMMGMMGDADTWTINGKSYPKTDPIGVRPGERVRLKLINMSMLDHPMHLHGHTYRVVGASGRAIDGPLKDTLTLRPMEQYEIELFANNPGTWLFHCHNLVHMGAGLMAEVRYG
jgi:multicopper oxidase